VPITSPGKCKTDYIMPKLKTINSMPNIPFCATIIILPTNEITPITNYCSAIKTIKNMEIQLIGIKSLLGTGDVKISNKLGKITILSLDEGSFRFFSDISSISCEPVEGVERHYSNCSNKDPIELKPKEQGFDEAAEIVFDRTETATQGAIGSEFDWSFRNIFKNKKDQIIFTRVMIVVAVTVVIVIIIFLYCYCNRTAGPPPLRIMLTTSRWMRGKGFNIFCRFFRFFVFSFFRFLVEI
jgi:hypothetical protein